jgi:hypothetical protein
MAHFYAKNLMPPLGGLLIGIAACGGPGSLAPDCETEQELVTDLDGFSALGFSANALIDALSGTYIASFDWDDGAPTELSLGLTYNSGTVVINRYTGSDCPSDSMSVVLETTFETADGGLDEADNVTFTGTTTEEASFSIDWNAYTLGGNLEIEADEPSDFNDPYLTSVDLEVRGSVAADGTTSGEVNGEATFEGVGDDDDWEQQDVDFDVATWESP